MFDHGEDIMQTAYRKKTNKIIIRAMLRRRLELKRNIFRLAVAMLFAMILATFTLSIRSFAKDRDSGRTVQKYYTSYTVQKGENLSVIARRFITDDYSSMDKYLAEVVSINHLISPAGIDAGQELILPYYSCETAAQSY